LRRISVRDSAKNALSKVLTPIAKHVLQSGISAREVQTMWRFAIVREAATRQQANNARINVAGIAAATGISRLNISRILKLLKEKSGNTELSRPHSANRVLAVWQSNPAYTNKFGRPKELNIFGLGRSFESLVIKNAGGLPVRAVLDELVRLGSVEIIKSKKVRLISAIPRSRGHNTDEFNELSDRLSLLVDSMFQKIRSPEAEFSISAIEGQLGAKTALPAFRRQVLSGGEDLLTNLRESFLGSGQDDQLTELDLARRHVRVAVIYHDFPCIEKQKLSEGKRKNFRRAARQ